MRMRALGMCVLLASVACSGSSSSDAAAARPRPKGVVPLAPKAPPPPSPFDAEGKLKPSETSVAWLPVPMGFAEMPFTRTRHHVFSAQVPVDAVTRYLDARALPSGLEVIPGGVAYKAARPRTLEGKAPALHIEVYEQRGEVRLVIDEPVLEGTTQITEQVARSVLAQEQAQAE